MVAEPIQLSARRGRPSRLHLEALQTTNEYLRSEVHTLRRDRQEDVDAIRPYLRRLEMVAVECGPAAMASVRGIEARLERMARRERRPKGAA